MPPAAGRSRSAGLDGDYQLDVAVTEGQVVKFDLDGTEVMRLPRPIHAAYEKALSARENVRRDIVESPHSAVVDPPAAAPGRVSPRVGLALFLALAGFFLFVDLSFLAGNVVKIFSGAWVPLAIALLAFFSL